MKNKDLRAESSNNNNNFIVLLEPCEVLFEGLWERNVAHSGQPERKKESLKRIFPDYTIDQRDLT